MWPQMLSKRAVRRDRDNKNKKEETCELSQIRNKDDISKDDNRRHHQRQQQGRHDDDDSDDDVPSTTATTTVSATATVSTAVPRRT